MKTLSLTSGELEFPVPPGVEDAARLTLGSGSRYPATEGTYELRSLISEHYGWKQADIAPENVLITAGARHAIYNVLKMTLSAGDEVIVPAPYWFAFPEMIEQAKGHTVIMPTSASENFRLDPARLEALITDRTRLFILTNPCNPNGRLYSVEELDALVEVLEKYPDVHILVDEIYEFVNFTDAPMVQMASWQTVTDRVVTVSGFSKTFAMAGWRVGYIVASEKLIQQYKRYQEVSHSGVSTFLQNAAAAAWQARETYLPAMLSEVKVRRQTSLDALAQIEGIRCFPTEGTYYLFPDVSDYFGTTDHRGRPIRHSVDLNQYLYADQRLRVLCGDIFGDTRHLRLSFGVNQTTLRAGLQRLAEALRKLREGVAEKEFALARTQSKSA